MNEIIVTKYDQENLRSFKDKNLIVRTDSLDQLMQIAQEVQRENHLSTLIVDMPYRSVANIDFDPQWENIPLIVYVRKVGFYDQLFQKTLILRRLNIRIILDGKEETVYTDLKVMASIGLDCGIKIHKEEKLDDEKFLDLASYAYLSPFQHASIQPFEHILQHLKEDELQPFPEIYFDESNDSADSREDNFYSHFIQLDECSACPAFRICNHKMKTIFNDCRTVMSEVYDYAENTDKRRNNQQFTKSVCQL